MGHSTCISACAPGIALCRGAHASIVSQEDVENYNVVGDTNRSVPLRSEGTNQLWYGGRFGTPDNGSINIDIVIRHQADVFPNQGQYAYLEDDAGVVLNISTVGFTNVVFESDWLTHEIETSGRLVVGYYVGNIDFLNGTADGPNDNLVHRSQRRRPSVVIVDATLERHQSQHVGYRNVRPARQRQQRVGRLLAEQRRT